MTSIETAIAAANEWQAHARPIILAYFKLEDAAFFSKDICEHHYATDALSKAKVRDYREARGYVEKAQRQLYDMLDGIRDMYYCDHAMQWTQGMPEAEEDALIAFNDALSEGIISVEGAVKMVEGEL